MGKKFVEKLIKPIIMQMVVDHILPCYKKTSGVVIEHQEVLSSGGHTSIFCC